MRRLAVTAVFAMALLLAWLLVLYLSSVGHIRWELAASALRQMPLLTWLALGAGAAALFMIIVALSIFGVPEAPPGMARASLRQVQCQHCKAVFQIRDTGHRPLSHECPSCHRLGIYTGDHAPVGEPPEPTPARTVTQLDLTCRRCRHRFDVTDTGARPLKVKCPACGSRGDIL